MFEKKADENLVQFFPIIFPNDLIHKDIADSITEFLKKEYDIELKPISAGEIYINCNSVGGNSTTLDLYANPNDNDVINGIDYHRFFTKKTD